MFFLKERKQKSILVLDIGSSSINCFHLLKKETGVAALTPFLQVRLPLLENPDLSQIERHARKAIRDIATEMHKKFFGKKLDLIYVAISVPWYFLETKHVKISRKESFRVTHDLLKKIMEDELELFERKAKEKFEDPKSEIEILDKEVMKYVVNGYPITNPFGKDTKQLELSIYLSAARKSFISNIRDILEHFVGKVPVKIVSEPFVLYKNLSDIVDPIGGYLVVDVGGEVTEVFLVRGGVLENNKSFVWGGNLVIRQIASSMNIDLSEALALFRARDAGDIKESTDKKILISNEGVCSQWQNFLSQSFSELGKEAPLPQTLVLLGGVAGSDMFRKCADSTDFASFTILGKPFSVIDLNPENFSGKIETQVQDRKNSQMTVPLLLALGAIKYAEQK